MPGRASSRFVPFVLVAVLLLVGGLGGCTGFQLTPCDHCEADATCKVDLDCVGQAGGPTCDTAQGKCVQCTASENKCDPTSAAPRCDTTAETCVACADDNDCSAGAGVCLPSGGCAAPDSIIHAASTGTDPQPGCGNGASQKPCSLEDALAIATAEPMKKVIRLDDNGTYTPIAANFVVNANVTIEAHTAILHHKNDGPLLRVTNGKSLTLLGGTIEGAVNSSGDGIRCDSNSTLLIQGSTIQENSESAIDSSNCAITIAGAKLQNNSFNDTNSLAILINGGSVTMYRSTLLHNRGGEIDINNGAAFVIVGNVFQNNGDLNGANPGIQISTSTNPANRLEFNTIVDNKSQFTSGVQCFAGTLTAQNNIIWNNTGSPQLGGACMHDYSVIGPTVTYPTGTDGGHNTSADPKLVSESTDPHLQPGSAAIKAANPSADLTGIAAKDIDGDARAAPADCGADQTR